MNKATNKLEVEAKVEEQAEREAEVDRGRPRGEPTQRRESLPPAPKQPRLRTGSDSSPSQASEPPPPRTGNRPARRTAQLSEQTWAFWDTVDLQEELGRPVRTLQEVPHFLRADVR